MRPDSGSASSKLFNTAFETGVRSVVILDAIYPSSLNLDRLVALDHLVVHTADVNGPPSLHPAAPTRAAEMLVRRALVDRGLLMMIGRGLIARLATPSGIMFSAGEEAGFFVSLLRSQYARELKLRADWLAQNIATLDEEPFGLVVHAQLERWAIQFQPTQTVTEGGE